MRLTVSYADEEVEISFDREGLIHLIRSLTALQNSRAPDHDHLMSDRWGSWELTTTDPGLATVVHHVRLELVGAEGGRDDVKATYPIPREN